MMHFSSKRASTTLTKGFKKLANFHRENLMKKARFYLSTMNNLNGSRISEDERAFLIKFYLGHEKLFFMFHCLSSVVGCCSLVSWKLTRSRECEKCDNLLIECGAILQGLSSRFTFYQRKINVENWFDNLQNISDTGSENACNRPELLLPTRMWWRERREIKILMYLIFFIPILCEPKHNVSQNQIRNYPPPRISRNFVRNNHPSMSKFWYSTFVWCSIHTFELSKSILPSQEKSSVSVIKQPNIHQ